MWCVMFIVLVYLSFPIQKVPKEWKKAPVWLMLQSKQYPRCKAKVLVAFELVPAELVENDTYPFYDDIRPSTKEATVSIFLVGVRLFSPVQKPFVEVRIYRYGQHAYAYIYIYLYTYKQSSLSDLHM